MYKLLTDINDILPLPAFERSKQQFLTPDADAKYYVNYRFNEVISLSDRQSTHWTAEPVMFIERYSRDNPNAEDTIYVFLESISLENSNKLPDNWWNALCQLVPNVTKRYDHDWILYQQTLLLHELQET